MPQNASVTLTPTSFVPGYCYPSQPQQFLIDLCKHIQAFLPGNYSTFVYGSTVPVAADQEKPWINTTSGRPRLYSYVNGAWVTFEAFKTGDIIMFSGDPGDVVDPWYLCNGENGTPDLRDKFVIGWSDAKPVGTTGGEETHILTIQEIPAHTHSVPNTASGGSGAPQGTDPGQHVTQDSGSSGGGLAHNNMPPYYALAFQMYKAS